MRSTTLYQLGCAAAALLLAGCAHKPSGPIGECEGCTSVYSEGGRLAIARYASADPSAVERVATSYCQDHQLGKPLIRQPPDLSKYPHWAIYLFECGDRSTSAVATKDRQDLPLAQTSAAQVSVSEGVGKSHATCAGMGFPEGTPEYANCVSKLTEMRAQALQLREQQRKQSIKLIEQGIGGLSPPTASPTPTTIRLPGGEVLTCTQTGNQVHCD